MADACVLRLENLTKRYAVDRPPIFENLNLELGAGEYLAIMGESGVGKSTLLNLLAGLDRPDAGSIRLLGLELSQLDDDAITLLRRRAVGFVFQAFHVLPYLTVEQNIALPLELLGVAAGERTRRTAEMLAGGRHRGAGETLRPRIVGRRGAANRHRTRALVHRPRLMLADEPTGNLDPRSGAQILALLRDQSRRTPPPECSSPIRGPRPTPPTASWCSTKAACGSTRRPVEREESGACCSWRSCASSRPVDRDRSRHRPGSGTGSRGIPGQHHRSERIRTRDQAAGRRGGHHRARPARGFRRGAVCPALSRDPGRRHREPGARAGSSAPGSPRHTQDSGTGPVSRPDRCNPP